MSMWRILRTRLGSTPGKALDQRPIPLQRHALEVELEAAQAAQLGAAAGPPGTAVQKVRQGHARARRLGRRLARADVEAAAGGAAVGQEVGEPGRVVAVGGG